MTYWFADSFDLYSAPADAVMGGTYWDSGTTTNMALAVGRFSGSRSLITNGSLVKSSGQNDAVHHIVFAFQTTSAISGTTLNTYFQLSDGSTNQCCIVLRSDGAILLTSATATGTVLATYTGAFTASNTWYAFEVEVVIHPTAGSFTVRKNGNPGNDFTANALNTRPGANNYANKLTISQQTSTSSQYFDDVLWRSDASSVSWAGDVRCYTRMPVSDAAVQWTPSGSVVPLTPFAQGSTNNSSTITPRYIPITPACDGTIGSISVVFGAANAGNIKCTIFSNSGSNTPGTVLGSATPLSNVPIGSNTFTFSTQVSVTRGTQYWVGLATDTAVSNCWAVTTATTTGLAATTSITYAAFPTANPATGTGAAVILTAMITPGAAVNAPMVADIQQDGATTYVSSSTVGQADLYGIASISATPTSVLGVVTRALAQKTDAGTRNIAVNLKSGSTTSNGTSTALNTVWNWIYKTDLVDPNTGVAWTATGVNNCSIGVSVTA